MRFITMFREVVSNMLMPTADVVTLPTPELKLEKAQYPIEFYDGESASCHYKLFLVIRGIPKHITATNGYKLGIEMFKLDHRSKPTKHKDANGNPVYRKRKKGYTQSCVTSNDFLTAIGQPNINGTRQTSASNPYKVSEMLTSITEGAVIELDVNAYMAKYFVKTKDGNSISQIYYRPSNRSQNKISRGKSKAITRGHFKIRYILYSPDGSISYSGFSNVIIMQPLHKPYKRVNTSEWELATNYNYNPVMVLKLESATA